MPLAGATAEQRFEPSTSVQRRVPCAEYATAQWPMANNFPQFTFISFDWFRAWPLLLKNHSSILQRHCFWNWRKCNPRTNWCIFTHHIFLSHFALASWMYYQKFKRKALPSAEIILFYIGLAPCRLWNGAKLHKQPHAICAKCPKGCNLISTQHEILHEGFHAKSLVCLKKLQHVGHIIRFFGCCQAKLLQAVQLLIKILLHITSSHA